VTPAEVRHIDALVSKAAWRYAKRCWWADVAELKQAGWTAVMDCLPRFDPDCGLPLEAFLWGAAEKAMKRQLWHDSSPTSGGWHRPERDRVQQRAPLSVHAEDSAPRPDDALAEKQWRRSVRARLHELVDPLTVALLLGEVDTAEAAAVQGVQVASVYRQSHHARCTVSHDRKLYELLRERKEW